MQHAKIYEITCKNPSITDKYVGITENLRSRRCNHKSSCHNQNGAKYNYHVYQFIRLNGGWQNWRLDTVADVEYPRGRTDLKKALEARYIRELGATLNCQIPGRTLEQYRQDHKEEIKAQMKQYRQEHKEEIKAKKNVKFKCPCGGRYTHQNRAQHFKRKIHTGYLEIKYYLDIYGD